MSDKFPLYPELPEAGAEEAQRLVEKFKGQLKQAAEEVLGQLYCDVAVHIESDSWTNFRNVLLEGFRNYSNRHIQSKYDFKEIRKAIFKDFKDEIIADLNQDMVEEIEDLKRRLQQEREWNSRRY